MEYSLNEIDADRCPMSQPDSTQVRNVEEVGRVLHSGIAPGGIPDETTFPLCDLLLERSDASDHDCGNSDGVSVQRTPPLTMDHLLAKSRELAGRKANRTAGGVAIARASALREIEIPEVAGQIVFVLHDGSKEDPGHAVIRMNPNVPDGLRKKVRKRIIDAFKMRLVPASP
jgi:hypothetical protein